MTRVAPDWDDDFIVRDCPVCDGSGRINVIHGYNPRDGEPMGSTYTCEACHGTGEVEEPCQPIESDDDLVDA